MLLTAIGLKEIHRLILLFVSDNYMCTFNRDTQCTWKLFYSF